MSFRHWNPRASKGHSRTNPTADLAVPPATTSDESKSEWDVSLAEYRAEEISPAEAQLASALESRDEGRQVRALRNVAGQLATWIEEDSRRESLAGLLAAAYALDPLERRRLRNPPPARRSDASNGVADTPPNPESYPPAFWAVEVAGEASSQPRLNEERRQALTEIVRKSLGVAKLPAIAESDDSEADVPTDRWRARLAEVLYDDLIRAIQAGSGFGNGYEAARAALSAEAAKVLPADRLVALDARVFVEAVEAEASDPGLTSPSSRPSSMPAARKGSNRSLALAGRLA